MLRDALLILLVLMSSICNAVAAADSTQDEQAALDAACEAARQTALAPMKPEIYQECIDKFRGSADECEKEAAGYNGGRINASSRFYDLPECEAAFEYRNEHNRTD
jgi:hypothetical protein